MRIAVSFIKWILAHVGRGLLEFHTGFKKDLRREPGIAFVAWLLVSLLSAAAMLLILGALEHITGTGVFVYIWYLYIVSCVLYLLYSGFSVMYNVFKAERAELFETIKNGR